MWETSQRGELGDPLVEGKDNMQCEYELPDNASPLADARPDQTAFSGDSIQLDGSGSSDSDGEIRAAPVPSKMDWE